MSVRRTVEMRLDSVGPSSVGGVRATAALTRTGIFLYLNPDGTVRREWRPPAEVFNPNSIDTLRGVPVTNGHPPDLVTTENFRFYSVGHVHDDASPENENIVSTITVEDAEAVSDIREASKRQLSCGYTCDLEMVSGTTPEGEDFDAIQTRIRYNHVALVAKGRAGSEVAIRVDSAGNEIGDQSMNEIEKLRAELAEKAAAVIVEKTRADRAEAEAATHKTRADALEAASKSLEASIPEKVKARAALVVLAREHAVTVREDSDDAEIRRSILAVVLPTFKTDGKDDAALSTALEVALARGPESESSTRRDAAEAGPHGRPFTAPTGAESRADRLRAESIARQNEYKPRIF